MSKIIVVGSTNVDMIACVASLPRPGETIGNARFSQANGGKGANQAVAAARLGGDVKFLTCVGEELTGHVLEGKFKEDGIDTSMMKFSKENPTGTALIYVADDGENCIAVAPGANNDISPEDMDAAEAEIAKADYLLLQLEIPMATVQRAVELAHKHGVKAIINPAPMAAIPSETLSKLYAITPNETEAEKLTGVKISSEEDAYKAAEALLAMGVQNAIITLGSTGSILCNAQERFLVPARKVKAVDTTAAGDVYNGALVAALSEGKAFRDAMCFATLASSISVTRLGAQPSVPARSEVNELTD